jgi:glucokinase
LLTLAVDIGGSKLAVGLVDESGQTIDAQKVGTPRTVDPEVIFEQLTGVVRRVLGRSDRPIGSCGVGCGGPMTRGGEAVSPLNIPAWRAFPLRRRVAEMTGLPTYVDNDAKALALAEGWRGAAVDHRDFVALVVSTGIGGGIVLDGRLLDGQFGNAGHLGHLNVIPEGRPCACGSRGCLEAEASGLNIEAITGRPAAEAPPEMIERVGTLVGRGVADVCVLLDLQLAVVAGSVALGYGAPFFAAAQAELDARARIEFVRGARIRPAALGADGPLVGAAAVARHGEAPSS